MDLVYLLIQHIPMADAIALSSKTSGRIESIEKRRGARLESVDVLRGLVMVLMALDHTRDFFHAGVFQGQEPLNFSTTTVPLFVTRWITHFCAPIFVFLAGTGAFLSTRRGKTRGELSWFLLTRGFWLVLLELTVIHCFGWNLAVDFHRLALIVIWAIGCSMIFLAGLVWLPMWAIATLGLTMIALHNTLDGVNPESWGALHWVWRILHAGGEFQIAPGWQAIAGYPLIPWIGVMATGYAFGTILQLDPPARRRWMIWAGVVCVALFVLLRASNGYGDPTPWSKRKADIENNTVFTILAFVHCHKYPPSLCYLLMTLGPALLLLAALESGTPRGLKPLLVFGRVPLFYYLIHLPLIHVSAVVVNLIRFGRADWLYGAAPIRPPKETGFGLLGVYLVWIAIVLALYPLCKWFADLKRRREDPWLSYL